MKTNRMLYLCMFSLLLLFASCGSNDSKEYYVTADHGLNIRATPSSKGKIIGKLECDDKVELISSENGWAKIKYNNGEAYVSEEYLKERNTIAEWLMYIILFLLLAIGGTKGAVLLNKDGTPDKRFKSNR